MQQHYQQLSEEDRLIWNLRDIGHTMRHISEGRGSQKRILILLKESGGTTQRALTQRLNIRPASASEVIGKLEAAGLIQRTPSESDRRTADIRLTQQGLLQAEQAQLHRRQRHVQMFSCLTQEEKRTLLALTEKLNASWQQLYCQPADPTQAPEADRRCSKARCE